MKTKKLLSNISLCVLIFLSSLSLPILSFSQSDAPQTEPRVRVKKSAKVVWVFILNPTSYVGKFIFDLQNALRKDGSIVAVVAWFEQDSYGKLRMQRFILGEQDSPSIFKSGYDKPPDVSESIPHQITELFRSVKRGYKFD
ncbi:MAG: hypothetical protein NTW04_01560 [Elusimicrobia bacterium]|nr:hypothetical protein [Elusimicrobiota bacterium]